MNDNGFIKYSQLAHSEMILLILLTFVGLVAVNGPLSILQTIANLTQTIYQSQIKTTKDIYQSNLPFLVWHETWRDAVVFLFANQTTFTDWGYRVLVINAKSMQKQTLRYDRSVSFL